MASSTVRRLIAAALILLSAPLSSFAANTGLTIQPVKASHELPAGQNLEGTILLTNASDEAIQVEVSIEDFIPLAGGDTIQFVSRAPGVTTVRDWITVGESNTFVFEKGESKKIPYTIAAPADAEPGSHFGVIFFKATRLEDAAAQLKVGTQVGMLVFVTVPGDFVQSGEIGSFTAPLFVQKAPVSFNLDFTNTGTVHFEPKGTITITNMFGNVVGEVPIAGQVVLPTGVRTMSFSWDTKGILLGAYTARAVVYDGEQKELTSNETTFYAFPLWYTLAFLGSVLLLFFIFNFIRKRVSFSVSIK